MTHWKYPEPSDDELSADVLYWLSFNPFWWEVVQGQIGALTYKSLWEDYSAGVEAGIEALMLPHDLPECPACPAIWVHMINFAEVDGGFVANGRGSWTSGTGWMQTSVGSRRGVEIKKTISATKILGLTMTYSCNSNTTNEIYIAISNPTASDLYRNTSVPNATRTDRRVDGTWDSVTEIRLGALNPALLGSYSINRLMAWGEGTDPF